MLKVLKIGGIAVVVLVLVLVVAVFVMASGADEKLSAPNTPFPEGIAASSDAAVIARGQDLVYGAAHCSQCHAHADREHPEANTATSPLTGGLPFLMGPMGGTWASNLTPDPETGIGKRTDAELARAITTGVLHDGRISIFMRYSAANLSREDLTAVISYLRALPPTKNEVPAGGLTTMGKAMFSMLDFTPDLAPLPVHVAAGAEPSLERGQYLAEQVSVCTTCHTAFDPMTLQVVGPTAGGGLPDPSHGADSDKEFVTPNLTSHATGYTGKVGEDDFIARMRKGRAFTSSIMPWENFTRMSESDLRSIYRYLKSLPPIDNDVGPTYRDAGWKKPG